jgi:hypothetical protein
MSAGEQPEQWSFLRNLLNFLFLSCFLCLFFSASRVLLPLLATAWSSHVHGSGAPPPPASLTPGCQARPPEALSTAPFASVSDRLVCLVLQKHWYSVHGNVMEQ